MRALSEADRDRAGRVRARAGTPEPLLAVLEHLAGDESLLLVFAPAARVAPESIGRGRSPCCRQPEPMTEHGVAQSAPGRTCAPRASTSAAPRSRAWRWARRPARWPSIRMPAPRHDYAATIGAIAEHGARCSRQPRAAGAASASACRARCRRRAGSCRTPTRPGSTAGRSGAISRRARPPGSARQRCQLLRLVGGGRRRRRGRARGVRRDPRHRLRRRPRATAAPSSTGRAASAASGATTRCPGRAASEHPGPQVLVRARRAAWRPGCPGPGLEADHARRHRRAVVGRGDRGARDGWRCRGASHARPPRQPPRPRPCPRRSTSSIRT